LNKDMANKEMPCNVGTIREVQGLMEKGGGAGGIIPIQNPNRKKRDVIKREKKEVEKNSCIRRRGPTLGYATGYRYKFISVWGKN